MQNWLSGKTGERILRKEEQMSKRRNLLALIGTVILLVSLAVPMTQCVPAAEEEAPPVEEEGPYEQYVASLSEGEYPVPQDCFEQAIKEGELDIYDWAAWWPEEIYTNFEKEFGIKIVRDNYADTDEMVAKFRVNPGTAYDYVFMHIREFLQLKDLDVPQQLNHDWIPNVNKYLPERDKEAWYDPGYQYQVPIAVFIITYSYNKKYVDDSRIPSWSVLFEPEQKYRGKIIMINSMYMVIGSALKYLGYSYNSDNEDELKEAEELLLKQKPYIMSFDSWPVRPLLGEEAWIAQQWYGDILLLQRDLESLTPTLPPEGAQLGVDNLVIPKGGAHPAAAHLWLNYLYRARVNALLLGTICHFPIHPNADEFIAEEVRSALPPIDYLDKCEYMSPKAYTGKGLELRTEIWKKLMR